MPEKPTQSPAPVAPEFHARNSGAPLGSLFLCSPAQAVKACASCLISILGQLSKDTQKEGRRKTQLSVFYVSWLSGITVAIDRGISGIHAHFEGSSSRLQLKLDYAMQPSIRNETAGSTANIYLPLGGAREH